MTHKCTAYESCLQNHMDPTQINLYGAHVGMLPNYPSPGRFLCGSRCSHFVCTQLGYNLRCKLVFWCRQIETISDLSFTWFSFFAFIIASFSVRCHEAACAEVPLRGRFDLFVGLSNNSPSKRERITFCYSLTAIITLSAFCFAKGFAIVIELLFEWTLLHPRCKQLVYFC